MMSSWLGSTSPSKILMIPPDVTGVVLLSVSESAHAVPVQT
jgi:hypothetical protein